MKLVGVNIGDGRDIFGRFRQGVMIPADQGMPEGVEKAAEQYC